MRAHQGKGDSGISLLAREGRAISRQDSWNSHASRAFPLVARECLSVYPLVFLSLPPSPLSREKLGAFPVRGGGREDPGGSFRGTLRRDVVCGGTDTFFQTLINIYRNKMQRDARAKGAEPFLPFLLRV